MSDGTGKTVYRLTCPHHGALGAFESQTEARTAAAEHFKARHTSREGITAPSATVECTEAVVLSASDLAENAAQQQK